MIEFESVKFKNFVSYGNYWTVVDLKKYKTTGIYGTNGNGKSTFLDALCFSLFGKPLRPVKKASLVNMINKKDCQVEVNFNSNGKQYGILVQDSFDDANKLLNGDVVDYRFKLVLTNDYISQPGDDVDARVATQELIKTMEEMRRVIKYTRAGTYNQGNLLWEFDFRVDSPQVIDSSKLVILNGYFRAKAKNTYIV